MMDQRRQTGELAMIGRLPKLTLLGSLLALGMGCSHARLVEIHSDGGGVFAVPDNTNSWPNYNHKHAEELMARQCPQGYVIDRESEIVVGQVAHTDTETEQHKVPVLTSIGLAPAKLETQQTTSYVDQKEWRIWFHPKGAMPSLNGPGDPPPPNPY